jgi:hypothetical protein
VVVVAFGAEAQVARIDEHEAHVRTQRQDVLPALVEDDVLHRVLRLRAARGIAKGLEFLKVAQEAQRRRHCAARRR